MLQLEDSLPVNPDRPTTVTVTRRLTVLVRPTGRVMLVQPTREPAVLQVTTCLTTDRPVQNRTTRGRAVSLTKDQVVRVPPKPHHQTNTTSLVRARKINRRGLVHPTNILAPLISLESRRAQLTKNSRYISNMFVKLSRCK